jgi:coenzyme PQQ biosynthesis protein PqqD
MHTQTEGMTENSKVPKRTKGLAFRRILDEGVAMNSQTSEVQVLNEVGCRVLELVDGHRSVAEIVETLIEEYDAPAKEIEQSVREFLSEAEKAKLIDPIS